MKLLTDILPALLPALLFTAPFYFMLRNSLKRKRRAMQAVLDLPPPPPRPPSENASADQWELYRQLNKQWQEKYNAYLTKYGR